MVGVEPHTPTPGHWSGAEKCPNCTNDPDDLFVVFCKIPLHLRETLGQFSIFRQNPTDLDECAHDEHRNLNRASRVEHTCGHDRPVLGECVGKGLGEPEARQVVAVCDHLRLGSVLNLNSEALT